MHVIRKIIQLLERGYSERSIARELSISRPTVKGYRTKVEASGLSFDELKSLSDDKLHSLIYTALPRQDSDNKRRLDFENRMSYFVSELKRTGVTRKLLWEEYQKDNPPEGGYSLSQFCYHFAAYSKTLNPTMKLTYQPGELVMVDFAGDKMHYIDRTTGEVFLCVILVCVLPYSGYAYVEALPNARLPFLIKGLNNMLHYFGGIPLIFKTDNMKQVVVRPSRYEPTFTKAMEQWGLHYDIVIEAARVRKPKDKAPAERQVNLTYQRIFAPLRNQDFFSLTELNRAIGQQLTLHNNKDFQIKEDSRASLFLREEKPFLRPLPASDYVLLHQTKAKVGRNYHVILGEDWVNYSVPYTYIGNQVIVTYDTDTVEIFLAQTMERIATHVRCYKKHAYITTADHMPEGHKAYHRQRGYTPEYFLNKAALVGTATHEYMQEVLKARRFTQQSFNACIGILKLGRQYGNDRLENGCKRALKGHRYNYRTIADILANGMDKMEQDDYALFNLPPHDNIRGAGSYE